VRRRRKRKRRSAVDVLLQEFQLFLLQEESSLGRGRMLLLRGAWTGARPWTRDSMCCCSEEEEEEEEEERGAFLEAVAEVESKGNDLK
jgi:hypothetical protein